MEQSILRRVYEAELTAESLWSRADGTEYLKQTSFYRSLSVIVSV